jgi:nucleotide-binding universal stress UspA family protein
VTAVAGPDGPIVVGVDASAPARVALRWAAAEARRWSAPLVVVMAWDVTLADELDDEDEPAAERHERMVRAALAHTIEAEHEALDGLAVETRVVRGGAVTTLLDAAEGAALLVVGARGRGGFQKLMLGSVSQQCVQHATLPVAVIR